ncbi:hypothetical protein CRENBAI_003799 [Crenichthys baileyi]|uniref:Uncharacterized protein n=1 Tax=Crenichthys baileyi TaxID=28760 RepID=A0AAV9SMW0_9TELE
MLESEPAGGAVRCGRGRLWICMTVQPDVLEAFLRHGYIQIYSFLGLFENALGNPHNFKQALVTYTQDQVVQEVAHPSCTRKNRISQPKSEGKGDELMQTKLVSMMLFPGFRHSTPVPSC